MTQLLLREFHADIVWGKYETCTHLCKQIEGQAVVDGTLKLEKFFDGNQSC